MVEEIGLCSISLGDTKAGLVITLQVCELSFLFLVVSLHFVILFNILIFISKREGKCFYKRRKLITVMSHHFSISAQEGSLQSCLFSILWCCMDLEFTHLCLSLTQQDPTLSPRKLTLARVYSFFFNLHILFGIIKQLRLSKHITSVFIGFCLVSFSI